MKFNKFPCYITYISATIEALKEPLVIDSPGMTKRICASALEDPDDPAVVQSKL